MPTTFAELLQRYLAHLEVRAYSPNTIQRVRIILNCFAAHSDPLDADADAIEAWLASRQRCARTRYTYIQYLSGFYRWGIRRGHLDANPAEEVDRPRLPQTLPRPIPDQELARALAAADPRMRLWLCLAAYQGMRCQEVAGLRVEDVMLESRPAMLVVAHGKGRRQRLVPLAAETERALIDYGMPASGPLFTTQGCRCPLRPQTVSIYIARHMRALGITNYAHTLRHWFGTQVYRQTRDIRATQEFLGHASVMTTQVYTAFSPAVGIEVVRRLRVRPLPTA
jgi:integrase/recombinase XerC